MESGSEFELKVVRVRLVEEPPFYSKQKLSSPQAVLDVVGEELESYDRELFCILNMDAKMRAVNLNIVSMGTLNHSLVHPREIFKSSILSNALGIILIHNHPSGDCTPSQTDMDVTKRLEESGEILGIPVIDHIIVGERAKLFSFYDNGLITRKGANLLVAEKNASYGRTR